MLNCIKVFNLYSDSKPLICLETKEYRPPEDKLIINFSRCMFWVDKRLLNASSSKREMLGRSQWISLCFSHEFFLLMTIIPFRYEKMVVHENFLKSKMK